MNGSRRTRVNYRGEGRVSDKGGIHLYFDLSVHETHDLHSLHFSIPLSLPLPFFQCIRHIRLEPSRKEGLLYEAGGNLRDVYKRRRGEELV
jgi:hypothetical protein